MASLEVIVVDDEPVAIERMRDLLQRIDGVELVGCYLSAMEALEHLRDQRAELILLDVEMPKMDGFDFVEALAKQGWLDAETTPCIAFVTAYPQFATDAFDTGALDFLCKPVRLSRLEKTIGRARRAIDERQALARLDELKSQLEALRQSREAQPDPTLWIHQRGQMVRVPVEAVDWAQAEGEYVRLHVREQTFLLRSSISALSDRLSNLGFVRIHRSTLINQSRLEALSSTRAGMVAKLRGGPELPVGRKYRPAVRLLQYRDAV